jgi:hypothetical protein
MWRLTATSRGFLARPAPVRAVAVRPGCEQSRWLPVAVDERGPDVPPEDRGPVVADAGIAAAHVPAVLPEPVSQVALLATSERRSPGTVTNVSS